MSENSRTVSRRNLNLALPPGVVEALRELARKYKDSGLDLFVFGSFARGDQYPTSDLDLGVEWNGPCNPELFNRLYWDVQNLTTIRPIDLVDFARVGADFKRIAATDSIYLAELGSQPYETESA